MLLDGSDERWDAVAEALLLYAARRDHVERLIAPALQRGFWVLCDRFADSTLAYQGYGRGVPLSDLIALHRLTLGDFAPDLTLILDLPATEGLARAVRRANSPDRFERLDSAFHQRLRDGFRRIAAAEPQRCVLIDAAGDVASVNRAMLTAVGERYGTKLSP